MGFSTPLDDWFRGELKSIATTTILSRQNGLHDIFDGDTIEKIWNEHLSGKANHGTVLWSMLMYQMWFNKYAT